MTQLKWTLVWLAVEIAAIIALMFFSGAWLLTWWQAAILIALNTAAGKASTHWERHISPPLPAGATVLAIDEREVTILKHGTRLFDIKSWQMSRTLNGATTLGIELSTPDHDRIFIGKAGA